MPRFRGRGPRSSRSGGSAGAGLASVPCGLLQVIRTSRSRPLHPSYPLPSGLAIGQFPRQHPTGLAWFAAPSLSCARPCLDDSRVFAKIDETVSRDQPAQALLIDAGKRPVSIATENVEWAPAERRGSRGEPAVEKPADIVNELLPTPWRDAGRRMVGVEAREAFGPGSRDAGVIFDDCGTLFRACS